MAEVEILEVFESSPEVNVEEDEEIIDGDGYSDWDVVTIEDEDDIEKRRNERDPNKLMVCFRCPNPNGMVFQDKETFFFHIDRHIMSDHFVCPTCSKPFTKLNHCVSHEIRVHGTEIKVLQTDPVVKYAKDYVKLQQLKKSQMEELQGGNEKEKEEHKEEGNIEQEQDYRRDVNENGIELITLESDNETEHDDEGWAFEYPSVHMNETYRKISPKLIQLHRTVSEPKHASSVDEEDVSFYEDRVIPSTTLMPYVGPKIDHMLDSYIVELRYARRKNHSSYHAAKLAIHCHKLNVKRKTDIDRLGRYRKRKWTPPSLTAKLAEFTGRNNKKNSGKTVPIVKMRVGPAQNMPSDSDSDDDYHPPSVKKRKPTNIKMKTIPKTVDDKAKLKHEARTKKAFSALINRTCLKCTYVWKSEKDLRTHRDAVHPETPVVDLMAMQVTASSSESSSDFSEEESWSDSSGSDDLFSLRIKKKRSSTSTATQKEEFVQAVGSTLTRKEKFLQNLGLVNRIRLQLAEKKPLREIKLPSCLVKLECLTNAQEKKLGLI